MSASVQTPTAEVKRSHNDSTSSSHDLSNKTTPVNRTPEKKSQRRSLQFFLPKLPSSESINMASSNMPSPCILTPNSALESLKMSDSIVSSDKSPQLSTSKLTRKESYKAQRKNYRQEKKRVADELLNSLKDPTVIVLADWLKVRGTLKSWTKLWCILKPGLLLLYKSPKVKSNHWVGTVVLNACSIIERPSKKDGFCFKLFHPMEQSIWAPRGPEKETIGAVVLPLPTSYLIFRAPSQAAGKCWLDALELSVRCSSLMVRSLSKPSHVQTSDQDLTANHDTQWSETDFEKHFVDHGNTDSDGGGGDQNSGTEQMSVSESDSELSAKFEGQMESPEPEDPPETEYVLKDEGDLACSCIKLLDWDTCDHCEPKETDTADHTLRKCPAWRKEREELMRFFPDLEWPKIIERILADEDARTAFEKYCNAVQEAKERAERAQSGNRSVNVRIMKVPRIPRNNVFSFRYDVKYISAYFQNGQEGERWEVLVRQGEQVEELAEENKSLIWFLVKQVRPGMDLSKVVLPTFILEPRSFLDKLADSYYHADILSKAVLEDDAFTRMKLIVQWYLSGFYKKPKGLKKPYNPILGETFRCYWKHPSGSRTFYIAEQVSHHPPVSAFYVTNRQDGFTISGSILAKSKFYGNSTSAILDGVAILTLLPRGEDYSITVPYALCKGILVGTLSMELGGKVSIECEKTGYKTELEFKLKPLIGGSDYINAISGKLKLGKETLATIDGYWDGLTNIKDKRTGEEQVLFNPTPAVRSTRLQRYTVPISSQENYESEKLWEKISAAILCDDQAVATEEKTKLENAQRNAAKERKESGIEWTPRYFEQNLMSNAWMYKHCDLRPWDPRNDLHQYEFNYVISTKTRHRTPMIRTASIVSVDPNSVQPLLQTESRSSLSVLKSSKRRITNKAKRQESISSSQDGELHSDSSQWGNAGSAIKHKVDDKVMDKIKGIEQILKINSDRVLKLQQNLETLGKMQRDRDRISKKYLTTVWNVETLCVVAILSALQFVMMWFFMRKT